jgi:hypothetical protein
MAATGDVLYCKIFVDAEDRPTLNSILADVLRGKADKTGIDFSSCQVVVRRSDDFDPRLAGDPEGFPYYQYILDIEPRAGVDPRMYIHFVGRILEALWVHELRAVAAADFEELLPRRGGYNSAVPRRDRSQT